MGLDIFPVVIAAAIFDVTTRKEKRKEDRLALIREIFEEFFSKCKDLYVVSENVTIDEMLESFRGRCIFRQYIKNKPARYGIKIFALVDSNTFYTSKAKYMLEFNLRDHIFSTIRH